MRRSNKSQRIFWILSIIVVASMILSSIIFLFEAPPPSGPTSWLPMLGQVLV